MLRYLTGEKPDIFLGRNLKKISSLLNLRCSGSLLIVMTKMTVSEVISRQTVWILEALKHVEKKLHPMGSVGEAK